LEKSSLLWENIAKHGARKRVTKPLPHRGLNIVCPLHFIVYSSQTSKTEYKNSYLIVWLRDFTRTCALMRSYKGREGNLSSSKAALQKAENRDNANTGLSPARLSCQCDKLHALSRQDNKLAVYTIRRRISVIGFADVTSRNSGSRQSHPNGYLHYDYKFLTSRIYCLTRGDPVEQTPGSTTSTDRPRSAPHKINAGSGRTTKLKVTSRLGLFINRAA
ncbi:hypothetical protein PSHT_14228, partial [Puccinia striiformis]